MRSSLRRTIRTETRAAVSTIRLAEEKVDALTTSGIA